MKLTSLQYFSFFCVMLVCIHIFVSIWLKEGISISYATILMVIGIGAEALEKRLSKMEDSIKSVKSNENNKELKIL